MRRTDTDQKNEVLYKYIFPLFIAFAAIGLFYLVIQLSNDVYKDSIQEVEIIYKDGKLSMPIEGDQEGWMIFWECDGGLISNGKSSSHFLYTKVGDSITWTNLEEDGEAFQTANIRATLYQTSEGKKESVIAAGKVQVTDTISLSVKDGKVKKVKDGIYSNPVKKEGDRHWTEPYIIQRVDNKVTLGFRTGEKIKDGSALTMLWTTDEKVLGETDLAAGGIPFFKISGELKKSLSQVNIVTLEVNQDTKVEVSLIKNEDQDDVFCSGSITLSPLEE